MVVIKNELNVRLRSAETCTSTTGHSVIERITFRYQPLQRALSWRLVATLLPSIKLFHYRILNN
jgi:hypothetical protein